MLGVLGAWSLCFRLFWAKRFTWRGRGLSKSFLSRVIVGVTPFRVLITLPMTYLLSPLPLPGRVWAFGFLEFGGLRVGVWAVALDGGLRG